MGMFDTITYNCTKCGALNYEQNKWGPCMLNTYDIGSAPLIVLASLEEYGFDPCQECGAISEIKIQFDIELKEKLNATTT